MKTSSLVLAALLVVSTTTRVSAQSEEVKKKQDLIDFIIPQNIQDIAGRAQEVIGLYTGAAGFIDVLSSIGVVLGLLNPSEGPSMEELFDELHDHLDSIAGALVWKIDATARANRYGRVMSAFYGAMQAMADGDVGTELLVDAKVKASEALFELEDGTAFMRLYDPDVTDTGWASWITDRPEVTNDGYVYDWRQAIPEYMSYLAVYIQVITAVNPNTKAEFRTELLAHRDFLLEQHAKISDGVRCTINNPFDETGNWIITWYCADIHSGTREIFQAWATEAGPDYDLEQAVRDRLPLAELQQMADTLEGYANEPEMD